MIVTRTPGGISNEHLFYNAEAVVYVEGGDASAPRPTESLDLLFWRGLFEVFLAGRRFYFKPRGGKPTLLQIADEIENGTVTAAIVCLDRDHDHVTGLRKTTGILYTRGYSWENDVWLAGTIEEEFYTLCGVDRHSTRVRAHIDDSLRDFAGRARWAVRADVLAAVCGRTVIPRDNFRCVTPPGRGWPKVDRAFLKSCVSRTRSEVAGTAMRLPSHIQVDTLRDVYGHLLAFYCRRILAQLLKTHCKESIRNEHASAIAIKLAREGMPPGIRKYYEQQFARLANGGSR